MRKPKHSFGRSSSPPVFRIALALFVVLCGGILLLASWRKSGGDSEPQESALEQRMRSAATSVSSIASDSRAAGSELEAARNALEAMDYGRSRRHMENAEEALDDLAERLDSVGSMLRNRGTPQSGRAEAAPRPGP